MYDAIVVVVVVGVLFKRPDVWGTGSGFGGGSGFEGNSPSLFARARVVRDRGTVGPLRAEGSLAVGLITSVTVRNRY